MAKKTAKKTKATVAQTTTIALPSMPIDGQVIDTSIDMKLSKQDLIDMVVEDTREVLEGTVQVATQRLELAQKTLRKAKSEVEGVIKAKIEETYKEEIAFASKYGKFRDSQLLTCNLVIVDGEIMTGEAYDKLIRHSENYNGRRNSNVEDCKGSLSLQTNIDSFYGRKRAPVSIDLFLTLPEAEVKKAYASVLSAHKEVLLAEEILNTARKQLQSVDKMGKKAKAQLIKRLLDSSDGGKQLLSNMSGIQANISQLLLSATSKG